MNTAYPATRSAHPFLKFRNDPVDMVLPRLRCPNRDGPTDPFVASERRDILPRGKCFLISSERFLHICRQSMHDTTRNLFYHHVSKYIKPCELTVWWLRIRRYIYPYSTRLLALALVGGLTESGMEHHRGDGAEVEESV